MLLPPPKISNDSISEKIAVNKAIDFMYSNIPTKLTLENIANQANYSISHFVKLFKKETGESPIEYLNRIRLEKSKKMLFNKNFSITETALQCGFGSSSYFSDLFKRRFNESPSGFKGRMNKK